MKLQITFEVSGSNKSAIYAIHSIIINRLFQWYHMPLLNHTKIVSLVFLQHAFA